jgi:hypothetical protein
LAAVVSFSTLAAGQNQLDIALEGPWILFTDKMDGKDVLVAVAPVNATAHEPVDPHSHYHHAPQMSSGNGFYLPSHGVFCLAFDKQCAPSAGSSPLKPGKDYTPLPILPLKGNAANMQWVSYGGNNDVVILPMPDFYHADGAWPIQFHREHKVKVSVSPLEYAIGLILHYSKAQSPLRLYACVPRPQVPVSVADCPNEAHDDLRHLIEVTNTGTLRLQMRAPDTTDDCDHHVRYAFHQMLMLLDPNYADQQHAAYPDYRYIEPAQGMDSYRGVFETDESDECFMKDPDDQDDHADDQSMKSQSDLPVNEDPSKQSSPFSGILNAIESQYWQPLSTDDKVNKNQMFIAAQKDFKAALKLRASLRITDVRKMGALAARSADQIHSLSVELQTDLVSKTIAKDDSNRIHRLEKLDTKNGADCRAAQILVTQ